MWSNGLRNRAVFSAGLVGFGLIAAETLPWAEGRMAWIDLGTALCYCVFLADSIVRVRGGRLRARLARYWLDLLVVLVPLLYVFGVPRTMAGVALRVLAAVYLVVSRVPRSAGLVTMLGVRPARLMVVSFLTAIAVGTVLLMHPAATSDAQTMPPVDALFTSTSAVCVTGLIVRDTATYLSRGGQLVVLALLQVGGLGVMTFSVSLVLLNRRTLGIKRAAMLQDMLDARTLADVRRLLRFILFMTLAVEAVGALVLALAWRSRFASWPERCYHALFQAISAFCNAGFSTFSNSLESFRSDGATNLCIGLLIVIGGLGFPVLRNLLQWLRTRVRGRGVAPRATALNAQTRLVLQTSAVLLAAGMAALFAIERGALFAGWETGEALRASLFQSVTARTAGFNTVPIGALSNASLALLMLLMFVGASPGSTGGGVKTTTFGVLVASLVSSARRRSTTELGRRSVPGAVVRRALTLLVIALGVLGVFAVLVLHAERGKPMGPVLFECVSAFGTVGLSAGITPELTTAGKLWISALMFIGRLGPLTMALALGRRVATARYVYAEEPVMIG